jgi:dipeptidyl aminopeptidase/acylaminoacyl peptidase
VRQRAAGGSEVLVVEDGQLGRVLYACEFGDVCRPVRFHEDGRRVYVVSNRGDDLSRLVLVDVATGSEEVVERDPEGEVDLGGALFSDATEALVATYYVGNRMRIYPREDAVRADLDWLRGQLPDGNFRFTSTEDDAKWIVFVDRDVDPGSAYLVDRVARRVELLYESRPDLPTEHLASMTPVRYSARDGESIPAYLMLPKSGAARAVPTIILPHGGPWARERWGYHPIAQFLANRGYAVLLPNFRGSTGYGKRFMNAGNENWGTGVMQHDLSDGVKYLVEQGIADPDRVAIMGGSYGGYATLAGLTFTPDLYAAGVSIVGPSNIITLLNSIPPYWGPMRRTFDLRVGNPRDPEDLPRLKTQSPFFHANAITAPLLVIQGANDPRVKQAESDQIVMAVRDLERPVAYLVAPDEGHGFRRSENRLAMFTAIEAFLATHLGGRQQVSVSAEVAARLAALTVDVDAVSLSAGPAHDAEEW